jgi:transposase-like protein
MPRTRNPYPPEFREQMIALARTGRSVEDLAREFEPKATRKRSSEKKPILLYLDHRTVEQVDAAAAIMKVSRTAYIREAINRNLRFFELCERHAHAKIRQQARR